MAAAPPPPPPQALSNGNGHSTESFSRYFESWISEQTRYLAALRAAAPAAPTTPEAELRSLVDQVLAHYEHYYQTKSAAAGQDIRSMFSPSWTSTTENLFLWYGGWRPSSALHLLFVKSGMQLDRQLPALLSGNRLQPDLGDLSVQQLRDARQLQNSTIQREREIDDAAASAQRALTGVNMVELVGSGEMDAEAMEREMKTKADRMKDVLEMADTLRLNTLREVVALLTPAQAVHFLIAAAEIHLAVHHFGRRKDGHPPPAAQ